MPKGKSRVVSRGKKPSGQRDEKCPPEKGSWFAAALGGGSILHRPVAGGASDPIVKTRTRGGRGPLLSKPTSPASAFWQPIKSFALSQLTSLVRRATLRESDMVPKYEKVHNFKVRLACRRARVPCVLIRVSLFVVRFIHFVALTGASTVPTSCGGSSLKESSAQVTLE